MTDPATTMSRSMYCRGCGYQLAGLSENRCPECVRSFDPANHRSFHRHPPRHWLVQWLYRAEILVLVLATLCGATLGWAYLGWREEQPLIAALRQTGAGVHARWSGPYWLYRLLYQANLLGSGMDSALWYLPQRADIVTIQSRTLTGEALHHLTRLRHLVRLEIDGGRISDSVLTQMGRLRLRSLSLRRVRVTDVELRALLACEPESLELDLTETKDADLVAMEQATGVTSLTISRTPITDAGLAHLANLKNLEDIHLMATEVTGGGLRHIANLPKLRWISVLYTPLTDEGLAAIRNAKKLRFLDLTGTGITDAGLRDLRDLTDLQSLGLDRTRITDAGIKFLQGLDRLEQLDLCTTQVTDGAVQFLVNLPSLWSLDISETAISDDGLQRLAGMKSLLSLTAHDTRVSEEGFRLLRAKRPDLNACCP
jgi:hypothetical protein